MLVVPEREQLPVADARAGATDLGNRLTSPDARETRKAGLAARALMQQQWRHD